MDCNQSMSLYQIKNSDNKLKPFVSSDLGSKYFEKDLEDWLEANPQVLVSDEPLLIIGRQVNTPVGTIDLLALDADGAIVVVELKRAPDQRKSIAQALEYAAWLYDEDEETVIRIANSYLQNQDGKKIEQAWQGVFDSKLPDLSPKTQHRIFVVIEGEDDRLKSVAEYLRSAGVDISLLAYKFYRTDNNDEFLSLQKLVRDDNKVQSVAGSRVRAIPTEGELLKIWSEEVRLAYNTFKDKLLQQDLTYTVKKTQVSFRKMTSEGSTFVCGFHGSGQHFKIWLRSDTLSSLFDFASIASEIKEEVSPEVENNHTDVWFILTYPASEKYSVESAELIIKKILPELR
jgi:Holliday junction resolvase-like predicted endonuclease